MMIQNLILIVILIMILGVNLKATNVFNSVWLKFCQKAIKKFLFAFNKSPILRKSI